MNGAFHWNLLLLAGLLLAGIAHAAEPAATLDDAERAMDERRFADAYRLYLPLADAGEPDAMLGLGRILARGLGREPDQAAAGDWFGRARDAWEQRTRSGDPWAFASLGIMHLKGLGMVADPATAARYFRHAARLAKPRAEQGDPSAQYLLGILYRSGGGMERDLDRSIHWLEAAGENGHRKAQRLLAQLYAGGLYGFPQDQRKAAYWRDLQTGVNGGGDSRR